MVTEDKKKKDPFAGTPFEGFIEKFLGENFEGVDWDGGFVESDGNGNYSFSGFPKEIVGGQETRKPAEKNYPIVLSGKKEYFFETHENENSYTAIAEIPCHIKRDEIKVSLAGSDLGISAGDFKRQYTVGFEADSFEIAHYKNGVLKMEFPKSKRGVGN